MKHIRQTHGKAACLPARPAVFLPVCSKCFNVTLSTGKKLRVAPYSGLMLAMVVRSTMDNCETPLPKNSTNFPATPACLRCCGQGHRPTVSDEMGSDSPKTLQSDLHPMPVKGSRGLCCSVAYARCGPAGVEINRQSEGRSASVLGRKGRDACSWLGFPCPRSETGVQGGLPVRVFSSLSST